MTGLRMCQRFWDNPYKKQEFIDSIMLCLHLPWDGNAGKSMPSSFLDHAATFFIVLNQISFDLPCQKNYT